MVPLDTVVKTAKMDVRLTRGVRNGITFGTGMTFNNTVDNFKDKALDPFYGGAGKPSFFRSNATGLAQDADDRIIYETDTGELYYDFNGNVAGGGVEFATLATTLGLTNADFVVI